MITTLHIMSKEEAHMLKDTFDVVEGAHYENLADGKVLLIANFRDSGQREKFERHATSRISLPHPVHEADQPISEEAAKHIVKHRIYDHHESEDHKLAAAKTHTVHDICKAMAKHNPKFRLF